MKDAARDQEANLHSTPGMGSVTGPSNSLKPLAIISSAAEIKIPQPSHAVMTTVVPQHMRTHLYD